MRTKRVIYNVVTGIIPQMIIGVLGFIKINIFINTLGIELNGLMQLFAQLFAYLSLAEGGIGSAIQFRLYKLLSKKDWKSINSLLSGAQTTFRKIAYVIIGVSLVISIRLDIFIKNNPFELRYVQIAFFLYLISTIISYFYISDRILLSSDQKLYKVNIIFNTTQILKFIIEIILLLIGTNIFKLIILYIITNFISFNILKLIVTKEYSWYKRSISDKNFDFKADIKHLLPHKVMNTVAKSTDMIVISSFLGLVETGIYGVYNYIVNFFVQIIDQISSAFFSIIGNYNAQESKEKTKTLFKQYIVFNMVLSNVLCVPLLLVFNKFIFLWVGEKMMVDFFTMSLFVFILYYRIVTVPAGTFISVNGLFKETKISIYIEVIINIILSIILVNFYGITGVLIGTVISLFASNFLYYPYILCKKVFKTNLKNYYINIAKGTMISICSIAFLSLLIYLIKYPINNYLSWFIFGFLIFLINLILTLISYSLVFKEEFNFIKNKAINRGKK